MKDESVLQKIADAAGNLNNFKTLVEIGPGMGALTKYLLKKNHPNFYVVELDDRWAEHLLQAYPPLRGKLLHQDFLDADLGFMQYPTQIVGNFPYNISSQIVFRVLDYKDVVQVLTGMFQKEVAKRISAPPGSKDYGVISVLTQAWYNCRYLFDVPPESFEPPPKVMSGVIQLTRKAQEKLNCDEDLFKLVVKTAFNQRRKTMRNSLKELVNDKSILSQDVFNLRPEQLSVSEFEKLSNLLASANNRNE